MVKAKHEEEKPVEPVAPEKRIEDLVKGLEWLRDNVVHGNPNHVEKINKIIKGE